MPNGLQGVTPLTIDAPASALTIKVKKGGFVDVEHTVDAGRSGEVRLPLAVDKAAKRAKMKAKAARKARAQKAASSKP